ncbi:MAG TPA: phosphoribosylanthranilate isomerase [Candidatus Obscuribacterales bacterium]
MIKICGITGVEDALLAIASGATLIGLVFAEGSPRRVSRGVASDITRAVKGKARVVGVFKDSDPDFVSETFSASALDMVQYHGTESPELLRALALPAIKAFELTPEFEWDLVRSYKGLAEMILLDRPKGVDAPDWLAGAVRVAAAAPRDIAPFLFAGGLTPENVGDVVRSVKPHGVDVASGVEKAPGVKDPVQVEKFCRAVKEASERCAH